MQLKKVEGGKIHKI